MYIVVDVSEGKRHMQDSYRFWSPSRFGELCHFTSWTAHVPVPGSCLSPDDPLASIIQLYKAYP